MPLPMVHLSVAVSLSEAAGHFPGPDFLLGNLAPDSIHMRPHSERRDKEHVHLRDLGVSSRELVQIFRERHGMDGSPLLGFAGGYLTHLLTDHLWWEMVIAPFHKKFPPSFPEAELRSLYYRDTDQIDVDLYRRMPWRPQAGPA